MHILLNNSYCPLGLALQLQDCRESICSKDMKSSQLAVQAL